LGEIFIKKNLDQQKFLNPQKCIKNPFRITRKNQQERKIFLNIVENENQKYKTKIFKKYKKKKYKYIKQRKSREKI